MPVGTVRGRYELDAPALRTLKDLEKQGVKTQAQMKALGQQIDQVGDKSDERRLKAFIKDVAELRRAIERDTGAVGASWQAMTRTMATEAKRQHVILDGLIAKYDKLGAKRISPQIDLDGVTAAIAQVELLESRLARLSGQRATPRVGLGGGFSGGGGIGGGGGGPRKPQLPPLPRGGGGGGGGRGGQGLRSVGVGPLNFGSRSGIALAGAALPAVQALGGATTALAGSLLSGGLGAGAVGLAGGGALAVGIGSLVSVAKPATKALGDAQKAQQKFNDAIADFGKNSDQARRAKRELDQAFAQAPKGSRQLLRDLKELREFWKKETKPGQESFIGLLSGGIRAGRKIAPTAARAANRVSRRTEVEGNRLSNNLAGKTGKDFLNTGSGIYDENLGNLRVATQYGAETFVNLMRASRPFVKETTNWIREWTRGWAKSSRDIGNTRAGVRKMVEDFKTWRDLAGATFRLLRDIFAAGRGSGSSLVTDLTEQLDKWDKWIRRNPAQVNDFFRRSIDSTKKLAGAIGQIVAALSRLGSQLQPLLDRFSTLVGLMGSLGMLQPGMIGLGLGALRGARGRSSGGGGGGGGVLPILGGGGGGGAAGAGYGFAAARGTYSMQRQAFGASRLGAGRTAAGGLLTRGLGPAARGAALGAGKAYLPLGLAFGALDAIGFQGSPGQKVAKGLNTATLGLSGLAGINPGLTKPQLDDKAKGYSDNYIGGLSGGRSIHGLKGDINRLRTGRNFAPGTDIDLGSGSDRERRVSSIQRAFNDEIRVRKGMVEALRAEHRDESRAKGRKYAGQIQEGYRRRSARVGPVAAYGTAISDTRGELGSLHKTGARAFATEQLPFLRQTAKGNKQLLAQYRSLEKDVIKRWRGLAGQISIVNGHMLVGNKKEWSAIADAIAGQARRGVSETSEEFRRLQSVALGALKSMGFTDANASQMLKLQRSNPGGPVGKVLGQIKPGGKLPSAPGLSKTPPKPGGSKSKTGDGPGRGGRSGGGGGANLMGASQELAPYAQDAQGYGLHVTSGKRAAGGRTASGGISWHGSGRALDLSGSPAQMLAFFKHAKQAYGSRLEELIHTPGGTGIKNGKPFNYTGVVAAGHYDHVHLADAQAAGALGGAGGAGGLGGAMAAGGINLTSRTSKLGGVPGALSTAAGAGIARGLEATVNKMLGAGGGGAVGGLGGKKTLSFNQVAKLAESVGLPGVSFAQIAKGESSLQPGAVGHDPGGTQGLGLWQITTGFNDDIIRRFGGRQAMFDPATNARAAKAIYDRQGIKAWYGTKYLTSPNAHYSGDGPGFAGAFRHGGRFVTPKGRGSMYIAGEGGGQEEVSVRPYRPRGRPAHAASRFMAGASAQQVHVAVSMGNVSVRSEADIEKLAATVGDKVGSQLTKYLKGNSDEELMGG